MKKKRTTACPARWGAGGWRFLHYLTLSMPDHPSNADVKRMRFLFANLAGVLPCNICARHWRELLRGNPPRVRSRAEAVQWLNSMHAKVNRNVPGKRKSKPVRMSTAMPGILKGWKTGMRDFLFITAMCLPKDRVGLFGRWCKAARAFVGREMPVVDARSRAKALNSLCRRYGCGRTGALRRYSPWLNTKTQRSAGSRVQQLVRAVL